MLVARLPVDKVSISDLKVLQYFVRLIKRGIPGTSISETRWVIATRDKGFCRSAEHECRSRRRQCPGLMFHTEARHVVSTINGQRLLIETPSIGSKEHGAGKSGDLQRVLEKVQELLSQPPPA